MQYNSIITIQTNKSTQFY